ncbi:FecR domain-containing protein [Pseudomonas kermanshahensis]|uniref:FecR domain-containing protein n=1 Tax=Pseudomonas kermanshahensis TaxID=2745482 RepID=UPI0023D98C63|nr:FecR domain-containing protein [Pseudomonas kermanshahensis]WEL53260.1 FecR domain-containing protein [Pseudomonas kermanshahensis]
MNAPVDARARQLAREAAQWLALQDAGPLDDGQIDALQRWRARSAAHEALWQKAEALRTQFSAVPSSLAVACLDRPDPDRRRLLGQALAIGTLAPLAWYGYRQLPVDSWRADLHTATGERRGHVLAGGGRVHLNTASAVNLSVQGGQHVVQLVRGEIAVDCVGPLQVQTAQGAVVATQASFCVRQQGQHYRVSVSDGAVRLQTAQGGALSLQAGQRVTLAAGGAGPIEAFDVQLPGWQQGLLMVENQPLGDVLRELDRYRPGLLRWDPALDRLSVTGTFQLDDNDRILALLAASLPLQVHYRTRYWVSLTPRKQPA